MKGTARPDSLTGKVQRALTDEWQTLAEIVQDSGVYDYRPRQNTVRAILERLCSEGRAEWNVERSQLQVRWRKPTGDASQRADGNAGTPVVPTPKEEQ